MIAFPSPHSSELVRGQGSWRLIILIMRMARLELARPKPHAPQTCVSTSSTTSASHWTLLLVYHICQFGFKLERKAIAGQSIRWGSGFPLFLKSLQSGFKEAKNQEINSLTPAEFDSWCERLAREIRRVRRE